MALPAVRAAGVVLTKGSGLRTQTLILYRPLRRDWSLPKGKLETGEHVLDCAVRECDEETGVVPAIRVPLGRQSYEAMGRPKTVDYWQAKVASDNGFVPDTEVSEVRWVGLEEARALLTYRRDVELVERAFELPTTAPLILLRHGAAVSRGDFDGDDRQRPLTGKGRSQARALVPMLQAYGIAHVYSSDSARCVETVRPFATARRVTIEQEPIFSEPGFESSPNAAMERLDAIIRTPEPVVLCTHRPVLPSLLETVAGYASGPAKQLIRAVQDNGLPPAGCVILHRTTDAPKLHIVAAEQAKSRKTDHDSRLSIRR